MALERDVQRIAARTFSALDTPRSLAASLLLKYGEWDQLVRLEFDPLLYREDVFYSSLDRVRRDRIATDLLRKCRSIETTVDLEKEARRTFFLCEAQCKAQNLFLRDWFSLKEGVITTPKGAPASMVLLRKQLNRARKWIRGTLGQVPDYLNGKFGPGTIFESASFDRRLTGFGLTAYDKISNQPSASENVPPWLEDHLVWSTIMGGRWGAVTPNRVIPRVPGNRFTSVPKDAKKNRGICIEPGLNIFGQLALGKEMKFRLQRRGLLLGASTKCTESQALHRRMAAQASRDGCHATLDLSNASDTICRSLVELLLPEVWHDLLTSLRSPKTQIQGRWVELEKFSSMGNGYTFELETLIFASLAHASGAKVGFDSSVFGDDTIVPVEVAEDVVRLYTLCGFTINQKKSYVSGPFRESCGGDFWRGEDVRPYFLEESPCGPDAWFTLHNGLASILQRFTMLELGPVLRAIIDAIPSSVRFFGPERLGDIVLHGPHDLWVSKVVDGMHYVKGLIPQPRKKSLRRYGPQVALTAAVLGLPSSGIAPRDSVAGYRGCWINI